MSISQETVDISKEKYEIQKWFAKNLDGSYDELKLEPVVKLVQKIFCNIRKKSCSGPVRLESINEVYKEIFKPE